MKKMLFSAVAFCAFTAAFAQDVLEIKPAVVADGKATLEFVTVGENTPIGVQTFFYVPTGWTVDKATVVKGSALSDHTCTVAKKKDDLAGYSKYQLLVASLNNTEFDGTEVCTVEATGPADDAIVPVVIKSIKVSAYNDAYEVVNTTTTLASTYIKVGNPTGVTFAPEGTLTHVVADAIASENSFAKVDLSKVTEVAGTFTYADGLEVVGTSATSDVKYAGSNANYYSVNVPFGGSVTGEVYEFKSADDKYATFESVTSVEAGKTYLAKGDVTIEATGVAVADVKTETGVSGNYVKEDPEGVVKFYNGNNLTVKPMRGLFDGAIPSNLRIKIDGELTGITAAEIDAQAGNTYDLQGRQTTSAKNGVFVVNGKKQFVK